MFLSGTKKPLAQVFREGNSRNRLLSELKSNNEDALGKKQPILKQTQICVRRSLKRPYDSFTPADKLETKTELFIMPPIPKIKASDRNTKLYDASSKDNRTEKKPYDPMDNVQRNLRVFVGTVGFMIKTSKLYPTINALWDVYGKVVKIVKGKHRFEKVLLVRNSDGSGPVLQCSYFDFDSTLDNIASDSKVRLVGKASGFNCLRTFKVEVIHGSIVPSSLTRLQNVNSFVLQQQK
ncbi:uncharacterized protein LOC106095551 [Stomoxys calcitrans]|uniref:Uncharacterized protein n=1 Tax=Stomoxys calcitrans TaxID=35570 RepID=A0A1I8NPK7_STOCA|nr:uncharacterized protein LOC106095551 [Stomoxys calcitrans]